MDIVNQILGTVDQKVLIGAVIILGILLVISIIKKLVKLAVFIIAMMLISTFILPIAKEYQEKYHFKIEDGSAIMVINGEEVKINPETCEGIKFNGKTVNGEAYQISMIISGKSYEFEVPAFIEKALEGFAKKTDIFIEKAPA